jgi:predicted lipoprotein with Yx(FWY)xxD motif
MVTSALARWLLCLMLAVGLTACGNSEQGNDTDAGEPALPTATNSSADENREPALKVEETEHGETIVDGDGRTVYAYADDEQGAATSTCKDACLDAWPPVPAPKKIDIDDLSGDVGVTKTADGKRQLTYNGWPLYYYAQDTKPGDANGQGVKDEWFVLNEAGELVKPGDRVGP